MTITLEQELECARWWIRKLSNDNSALKKSSKRLVIVSVMFNVALVAFTGWRMAYQ